jgi:predicted glycosyltransferase
MATRIMFYCQHVLGMGHLVRSAEIARALARDFSVLFVTGGEIPEGFRFPANVETLQLIPLKTSPDFSDLQLCDLSWDLDETKAIRRELLLQAFEKFQPDILITELFPFGRKQFSFELLPLLTRARNRAGKTMIVSSIRDILVNRREQAKYEQRVCEIVNSFYDLVLVHGDERFQTLEETFSRVSDLQCPVAYTGYVVQQSRAATAERSTVRPERSQKPTIVVSNGSGKCPSGHLLLESILRAAPLLQKHIPHQLQVFAGPLIPEDVYESLQDIAAPLDNVTLARYTPDLPGTLRLAQLSISMAGYNTVMDILTAGVRALVYPVTGNGDEEQSIRAGKLAAMGVLGVLGEGQFEPARLARKIEDALRNKPSRIRFNAEGAANSALLLKKYFALQNDSLAGPPGIFDQREVHAAGTSF